MHRRLPTSIDILLFIRKIGTGNVDGAAETVFSANILGGMCARVCPAETLCEGTCVRNAAEDRPVRIGLLQRHATDRCLDAHAPYGCRAGYRPLGGGRRRRPGWPRLRPGAGAEGREVTILDARGKAGGLNEFGIAAYKAADGRHRDGMRSVSRPGAA